VLVDVRRMEWGFPSESEKKKKDLITAQKKRTSEEPVPHQDEPPKKGKKGPKRTGWINTRKEGQMKRTPGTKNGTHKRMQGEKKIERDYSTDTGGGQTHKKKSLDEGVIENISGQNNHNL